MVGIKNIIDKFRGNDKLKYNATVKAQVLKNREGLLDAMTQRIKDVKQCPYLMGSKCITDMCEHFMEWKHINKDGSEFKYFRCLHKELPMLMIELITELRNFRKGVKE